MYSSVPLTTHIKYLFCKDLKKIHRFTKTFQTVGRIFNRKISRLIKAIVNKTNCKQKTIEIFKRKRFTDCFALEVHENIIFIGDPSQTYRIDKLFTDFIFD